MSKRIQNRLDTQAAVFDAAVDLIDAHGYDNVSVEEISEAAGIGRATFFRHFETKAGLLREHNRRLTVDAQSRIDAMPSPDTVGCLEAIADAIHDSWIAAGPGLRRLGADAAALADPTGGRTHPELLELVVEVVRTGRADGELSTELPPPLTAYLVVAHLAGAAAWWFNNPDDDLRELLDHSLDQCLTGIAPNSKSAGARGRATPKGTA